MVGMSRRAGRHLELVAPPAGAGGAVREDTPPPRRAAATPFDDLYARHAGYVAGLVGRILGRDDEVADVVQDVFLVAHRRMGDLRNPEAARAWLGTIAAREAFRRLRWRRLRRMVGLDGDAVAALAVDPKAAPEIRPLAALLYATLDRLPPRDRIAWALRHLVGEPLDAVAELCGCSLATAKRRIAAAERALRPILGGDDGGDATKGTPT
jgi:RNA polymerase sigma-70 factor (ECF subfamily)